MNTKNNIFRDGVAGFLPADVCVLLLAGLYAAFAGASGSPVSAAVIEDALPYLLLYAAARLCFSISEKWMTYIVCLSLCLWTIYEAALGLLQFSGFMPSGHASFPMTGTFSNPGPYGGLLSAGLSAAAGCLVTDRGFLSGRKSFRSSWTSYLMSVVAALTVVLGILVLPASMSRAGWFGCSAALCVLLLRETPVTNWIRTHKSLSVIISFVCIALAAGAFMMKRDSALGRLHIWDIEVRAVVASPCSGYGPGLAMGAYGQTQERYFADCERSEQRIRVAGCPEYAFNEYLKVGMETGIPGLLLSALLVSFGIYALSVNRSPLGYSAISLALFAFFSYPLSIPSLAYLSAVLLASGGRRSRSGIFSWTMVTALIVVASLLIAAPYKSRVKAGHTYHSMRHLVGMELYDDAVEKLEPLYPELQGDARYLYDYGYSLFRSGNYEESVRVLAKGTEISSDPMFHNIIGRSLEAMGDVAGAEKEYVFSHNMLPCRLYPLVLLMDMYIANNRFDDAVVVGEKIAAMPVNEKHGAMMRLKLEAEDKLNKMKCNGEIQ